ncbi:hypothetical protein FGG90_15945 (plasmid) [Clavibacter tessellarius]|uniref:hypothetical protein n=1 Tax=Clavibacter tessellarius TaxID=31965 RepID=UPI0039BFC22D|nr:hypothetical protein FGG90_15945 [Clavibacter michiganensis subsp. tessellarius]
MAQTRAIRRGDPPTRRDSRSSWLPVTTHGDTFARVAQRASEAPACSRAALRESLLRGECDLVVHSLKDLPRSLARTCRRRAVRRRTARSAGP